MGSLQKGVASLSGAPIAAMSGIGWKLTPGVRPYVTQMSVDNETWETRLRPLWLQQADVELVLVDARGVELKYEKLTILHVAPSAKPSLTTFALADKRWRWGYASIHRDLNIARRTGNRTALDPVVPVELLQTVDEYRYFPYSIDSEEGSRWTPRRAVENFLEFIEDATEGGSFEIESFPTVSRDGVGEFTLQNVSVRDSADVALQRLLSYIPGAEVYINMKGDAIVYDGLDCDGAEKLFESLPPVTWSGEKSEIIDRRSIRPKEVTVFYEREVEAVFDFEDDYSGGTQVDPVSGTPYLDNVIQTVDTETTVTEYDAYLKRRVTKTVPPGTWVTVASWLVAMNKDRPKGSLPWTFETIRTHWLKGDLDGVFGGRGLDLDEEANVAARIQALKQHFRRSFRINRAYMEVIKDVRAIRVALLDPVTGTRAPAAAWGQACSIPTTKGKLMASRFPANAKVFRNVDYLAPHIGTGTFDNPKGKKLIETSQGPTKVNFVDKDIGVFTLDWIISPYGTVESFVPCHLVEESNTQTPAVITRDLSKQDEQSVGAAMKVEGGTNGIFLRDKLQFKVMVTIVPAAPNNANIYHFYDINPKDAQKLFTTGGTTAGGSCALKLDGGQAEALEIIVPPGEATARFAHDEDKPARETLEKLLGLDVDDPNSGGIDENLMPGYVHINEESHLDDHAISVAAEALVPFADARQGTVATQAPENGVLELKGNMSAVTARVSGSPGAKIDILWQFPGQQKPIPRAALMPETVRRILGGVLPYPSES